MSVSAPKRSASLRAPSFRLRTSAQAQLSHDGTRLAQLSQRLVVWDVASRSVSFEGKLIANEHEVALSPDGRTLVVKGRGGELVFLDVDTRSEISRSTHSPYDHSGVQPAFSPDVRHLFDVQHDATIRLFEVSSGKELARHVHFDFFSRNLVVARGTGDCYVDFGKRGERHGGSQLMRFPGMDVSRAELVPCRVEEYAVDGVGMHVGVFAVDAAGRRLVMAVDGRACSRPNALVVLDLVGGGTRVIELPSSDLDVRSIVVTDDGLIAASIHDFQAGTPKHLRSPEDDHIHFYDAASGDLLARWFWHGVWNLSHSPVTGAFAIGGSRAPGGALLAEAPLTLEGAEWLAAHPCNRAIGGTG